MQVQDDCELGNNDRIVSKRTRGAAQSTFVTPKHIICNIIRICCVIQLESLSVHMSFMTKLFVSVYTKHTQTMSKFPFDKSHRCMSNPLFLTIKTQRKIVREESMERFGMNRVSGLECGCSPLPHLSALQGTWLSLFIAIGCVSPHSES